MELNKEVKINRILTKTYEMRHINQMKQDCFMYNCFRALRDNAHIDSGMSANKNFSFYFYF
jgi:hypothetical protein